MRCATCVVVFGLVIGSVASAGPLTPPGAPGPTMKTLDQVEPGTPISALAGDSNAAHVITSSGRYYLDRDILSPGVGKNAIRVSASTVEIDFNGFSIRGDGSETLSAISLGNADVVVHGGSIVVWGGPAITENDATLTLRDMLIESVSGTVLMSLNRRTLIERCVFEGNTGPIELNGGGTGGAQLGIVIRDCMFTGMDEAIRGVDTIGVQLLGCVFSGLNSGSTETKVIVGDDALISRCSFVGGGESALFAGEGLRMSDCIARGQGVGIDLPGIFAGSEASVSGCTVSGYSGIGIYVGARSSVRDCTVSSNGGLGISATQNALISGNTLEANGGGISATFGSRIVGNALRSNGGAGVQVDSDTFVGENTLDGDGVVVTGNDNVIDGNTFTDNSVGVELNATLNVVRRNVFGSATISGTAGFTGNLVYTIRNSVDYQSSGPFDNLQY